MKTWLGGPPTTKRGLYHTTIVWYVPSCHVLVPSTTSCHVMCGCLQCLSGDPFRVQCWFIVEYTDLVDLPNNSVSGHTDRD